jgi:hypothetical protein
MSESDDRREHKLPVTAEVGGEGGSYADPTTQVATFEGDVERTSEPLGDAAAATNPEDDKRPDDIPKYPDEA